MEQNNLLKRKILIDFIIIAIVGFPILFIYLFLTPYQRGFFCDDETIRHPFQTSTVSSGLLYVLGFGIPISIIILNEMALTKNTQNLHSLQGHSIPNWLWNSYIIVGIFLFGAASCVLLTDTGKYTVGRLRPHFYTKCLPDVDCNKPENKYRYITEFKCTNIDEKDMRLSFPSGHSSFVTYTMLYLILYLEARFHYEGSKLLKHLFQFGAFILAFFTCLTRISDYKHHPEDVLAGAILGAIFAIFIIKSSKTFVNLIDYNVNNSFYKIKKSYKDLNENDRLLDYDFYE